jgi:ABC-2 type transport system ATP-binding protein
MLKPDIKQVELELTEVNADLLALFKQRAASVRELENHVTVMVDGDGKVPELLKLAVEHHAQVNAIIPHRETLEDLFVRQAAELGMSRAETVT